MFQAVRPLGRALSVHQGKGLSADAARIGALMEAVESDHAERFEGETRIVPFASLPNEARAPEPGDFAEDRDAAPGEREPVAWTAARRLADGSTLWVPVDCVSLDYTRAGDERLDRSSNGLGARHDLGGATLSALLELIERDAFRRWASQDERARARSEIDGESIPFTWWRILRGQLDALGMEALVWQATPVVPTAVLVCEIVEPLGGAGRRRCVGAACRLDFESALAAAVAEAAQSRLTTIAGARDDILGPDPAWRPRGQTGLAFPLPPSLAPLDWRNPGRRRAARRRRGGRSGAGPRRCRLSGRGHRRSLAGGGGGSGGQGLHPRPRGLRPRAPTTPPASGAPMRGGDARLVVFAGPSIRPEHRLDAARFDWRGPAIAGDALTLLAAPPDAVVLIDGLFDEAPAIRHKEILELIAAGVAVIGGASMGALRAAELHPFGMIGVGAIFRAYVAGRLEGDDEVAVAHAPAEWDYAPFGEPLVNIRATLLAALRARIVEKAAARALLRVAAAQFYKDRTWDGVLAAARAPSDHPIPVRTLREFEAWLPSGRFDLKRRDAHACLDAAVHAPPPRPLASPPRTPFTEALAISLSRAPSRR